MGSCFPDSFGGSCSGTPRECQDCNRAITCQERDVPTRLQNTRHQIATQPRRCRCNGHFNARGDGECKTKFNGGHFCYINPGDCSDGVRSTNTGLWWSYQACNGRQATTNQDPRQPKSIGQQQKSSLFEEVAGGTCVTICDNWPFAQCKVGLQRTNGGHQAATCVNPYTGSTNRFNNQPQKFSNYPECANIPTGCKRCDETCSLRDGKSSRFDY